MKRHVKDFLALVDAHPRVGWYVALISTLNAVLQIADLFK